MQHMHNSTFPIKDVRDDKREANCEKLRTREPNKQKH